MRRLLLISYAFPPAPSPGALRTGYIARYLPAHGWQVTVLTHVAQQPPFDVPVVGTREARVTVEDRVRERMGSNPHTPLRSALRRVKDTLLFPDPTVPWVPGAIRAGTGILRSERFDAIVSSALPTSVHLVGWALAQYSKLPWIADYRDPWSSNAYMPWGPLKRAMERGCERIIMRRAQRITTISRAIAQSLSSINANRPVTVIPNAYDPADWEPIPDMRPEHFDLCFTGSMYDGKRSPEALFAAIARLRSQDSPAGHAARVHFYGPNSERVAECAERYGLSPVVRQHGVVSRQDALRAQRSSAVLLIFLSNDPKTAHETGSKYLEYLGARRPILVFGQNGSALRQPIEANGLGWFADSPETAAQALQEAYARFQSGNYRIAVNEIAFPTARGLADMFARELEAVLVMRSSARGAIEPSTHTSTEQVSL